MKKQIKMASCFQSLWSGCHFVFLLWAFASIFKNASIFGFDSKNASICVDFLVSLVCIKVGRVFSVTRATLIQRNMDNACKSKGFSPLVISFLLV